eukprot:GFKZ01003437.1.p1 GENE.GFKZ01003437.1~~GFKZ01003437.1.p1  ORF type:complete len:603 (-),score=81.35 GFKZ01003437.1:1794-3602(-)
MPQPSQNRHHPAFLSSTPLRNVALFPPSCPPQTCLPVIPRVARMRMSSAEVSPTDSTSTPISNISSSQPSSSDSVPGTTPPLEAEGNAPHPSELSDDEIAELARPSDMLDAADLPAPPVPDAPMDYSLGAETAVVTVPEFAQNEQEVKDVTWLDSVLESRGPLSTRNPLAALRAQANADVRALKVPTRKMEPWRFTNLRSLYASRYVQRTHTKSPDLDLRKYVPDTAGVVLVFIDGVFDKDLSILGDDSGLRWKEAGGYFGSVGDYEGDDSELRRLFTEGELGTGKEGGLFPAVAHAIGTDAAVLEVPDGFSVGRPVAVLFVATAGETPQRASASAARLAVLAGKGSHITLLESYVSADREDSYSLTLGTTAVRVSDDAKVVHYYVNDACLEAHVLGHIRAEVHGNGHYECRSLGLGSKVGRLAIGVDLVKKGAHGAVLGSLVSDGYQVLDIHSRICHDAESTTSEQLQKNVAADHARTVFKGRIIVTENGTGTDSSQLCRSLLLSNKATVDAMPVLEISTDDVKCSHGATVSDLEGDELFYCQSRGLTYEEAQTLLISGFAMDVVGDCPFPTVRQQIAEKVAVLSRKVPKRERLSEDYTSV